MRLVDANVLLYAVNRDAPRHRESRRWLDQALSGGETVAFAWIALLAFVRLSTKVGVFPSPLSVEQAMDRVDAWLGAPGAVVLEPTPGHAGIVRQLLSTLDVGGNIVSDAHLAALAIEHRCSIVTYDADFGRFDQISAGPPA